MKPTTGTGSSGIDARSANRSLIMPLPIFYSPSFLCCASFLLSVLLPSSVALRVALRSHVLHARLSSLFCCARYRRYSIHAARAGSSDRRRHTHRRGGIALSALVCHRLVASTTNDCSAVSSGVRLIGVGAGLAACDAPRSTSSVGRSEPFTSGETHSKGS